MNRRIGPARTFAGPESRHGPHRATFDFGGVTSAMGRSISRESCGNRRRCSTRLPPQLAGGIAEFSANSRSFASSASIFSSISFLFFASAHFSLVKTSRLARSDPAPPNALRISFGTYSAEIVLRVAQPAERLRFNQNRAFACASAVNGFLGCRVHRHHASLPSTMWPSNPISLCAVRQILKWHLRFRTGVEYAHRLFLQDQTKGASASPRNSSLRERRPWAAAVPNPVMATIFCPRYRRPWPPSPGSNRPAWKSAKTMCKLSRSPKWLVPSLPSSSESYFAMCCMKMSRGGTPLHEQRPDIADHRRQAVVFFPAYADPTEMASCPRLEYSPPTILFCRNNFTMVSSTRGSDACSSTGPSTAAASVPSSSLAPVGQAFLPVLPRQPRSSEDRLECLSYFSKPMPPWAALLAAISPAAPCAMFPGAAAQIHRQNVLQLRRNFFPSRCSEQFLQRSRLAVRNPARHDQIEIPQIRGNVVCKSV